MPDESIYEIRSDNDDTSTTLDDPVVTPAEHTTYNPFLDGQVVKPNQYSKYIRNPTPSSSMRLLPVSVSSNLRHHKRHRKRQYHTTQAVSERLSPKRQRSSAMRRKKRRRSTARKSRHPSPAWKIRDPSPAWKSRRSPRTRKIRHPSPAWKIRHPSPAWKSRNSPTPDYQVNETTHIDFRHIDPDKMDGNEYNLVQELTNEYFKFYKDRGLTNADAREEAERNIVERHRLGDFYNNSIENIEGQKILYPVTVVNKLDPTSPSPSPSCGNCMGIRLWGGKKSRRLKKQKHKTRRKKNANAQSQ